MYISFIAYRVRQGPLSMLEPNKIPMTCIYQARTEDPDHLHSIVATKDACDSRMMDVHFLLGQTLG